MITIRKDGRVVSRSRNLRGIMRYSSTLRRDPAMACDTREPWRVRAVHVLGLVDGGALLRVRWMDGAYSVARFASLTTCRRWVQARRYWPAPRVTHPHHWAIALRGDA